MKLTTIVLPLAISLLNGVHAWANDENGTPIANMKLHEIDGSKWPTACPTRAWSTQPIS
jgi:hypothetical protein